MRGESPRSTTFLGRIGVLKDRATKQVVTVPLKPMKATRGKKNLGPESKPELQSTYKKHFVPRYQSKVLDHLPKNPKSEYRNVLTNHKLVSEDNTQQESVCYVPVP